ncbi:MAG: ABC transporter permease [Elusimicrobia bacterium]|nr:ABC transporter permease [Elusimicrobiota bacterium]
MIQWLGVATLWQRELLRFYRDRARVIGAFVPPVVFWLLIGSGIGRSLRVPGTLTGMSYLQYFFPGTILLVALFTAIFSTISIIEDRREGFLQSVLVSPISRLSLVLGKILGSATLAFLQGAAFLVLAPAVHIHPGLAGFINALILLGIASLGLSALGFLIAWMLDSTQGFHSIMNLFLIPMWLLSGALFPAGGAASWLRFVMKFNPLYYAMNILQANLTASWMNPRAHWLAPGIDFLAICAFTLVLIMAAAWAAEKNS